ncbi:MAG: uroporphyrinogen decarboxylase family protein, partial [Anaerolineales bacterium]|nr:uroporphyrinogen decarboxylase family protein [Anaerolineales bacterium]
MTSKDRLFSSLALDLPDKVPFVPKLGLASIKYAGLRYRDVFEDIDKWVYAQLKSLEDFHVDAVWDFGTAAHFAEPFGGRLIIFDDEQPANQPFIESKDQVGNLIRGSNITKSYCLQSCLKAVNKLKRSVGSDVPVIGFVPMPFRFASIARGMHNLMLDMILNPDMVRTLQEYFIPFAVDYAEQIIDAGADLVSQVNAMASKNCISRKHYQELVHPYSKRFFQQLKERGIKSIYHTCGNWSDRFDLAINEGAECLWIDWMNDLELANLKKTIGSKICLMGNLDVAGIVLNGAPDEVARATRECLTIGAPSGGFILSGSCIFPRDTKPENIIAIEKARNKFRLNKSE